MDISTPIDITFDFQSDTPPGKDPDALSPTLRRYHRLLWSTPLPSGAVFDLVDTTPHVYLHHRSQLGEFWLASDAVIPTFRKQQHIEDILDQIPGERWHREHGCDTRGWLSDYLAIHGRFSPTRAQIERLFAAVAPIRCLETNVYPFPSPREAGLAESSRDSRS